MLLIQLQNLSQYRSSCICIVSGRESIVSCTSTIFFVSVRTNRCCKCSSTSYCEPIAAVAACPNLPCTVTQEQPANTVRCFLHIGLIDCSIPPNGRCSCFLFWRLRARFASCVTVIVSFCRGFPQFMKASLRQYVNTRNDL